MYSVYLFRNTNRGSDVWYQSDIAMWVCRHTRQEVRVSTYLFAYSATRATRKSLIAAQSPRRSCESCLNSPPCVSSAPTPAVRHSPHLGLDSEWVTPLFTIFQIPSQVFGLAGCPAFSRAITGLQGFSNGAFEEITLFSPSSREKTGDVWPTAHIVNHTDPARALSDAFGY